jgi:hypothetical protein
VKVQIVHEGRKYTIKYRHTTGLCSRLCGWLIEVDEIMKCALFKEVITNMHTGPRCQQCIDAEKNSGGDK